MKRLKIVGNKEEIINALFAANAVGFNPNKAIRFKAGILSPGAYINNRALPSHPKEWTVIKRALINQARALRGSYDVIASIATGAIIHGGVIAHELKVPHVIVKTEEKKGHGLKGLIDGDIKILDFARVLLFEDMSTTFKSPLHAMNTLEEAGAKVTHTLLVNSWNLPVFKANSKEYSVYALCTGQMIFDHAVLHRMLQPKHELILSRWFEHPEDEEWSKDGKWELPT